MSPAGIEMISTGNKHHALSHPVKICSMEAAIQENGTKLEVVL